ncbi:MAG: response regulator [Paucibacter sp.]|nr:response regulator [Roseateles sp.]
MLARIPCGIAVFDRQGGAVCFNQHYLKLLELPASLVERPGLNFEDVVRFNIERGEYGEAPAAQAMADRLRAFARAPHDFRLERVRPNGVVLELRGALVPEGGFVTTAVDVSDRRRYESDLIRSETLLHSAIEAIEVAFALFDPEDRLLVFNQRFRDTYVDGGQDVVPGVPFETLLHMRVAAATEHPGQCFDGGPEAWLEERLALHRSGAGHMQYRVGSGSTARWLRVSERRLPDGHTALFRFDVTDLMRATEAAERASEAKSQFLANMSHEIRTPMNAVLGMLKLLQRTPLSSRQLDYAGKAESAARSLLGLLNDILDYSKVEAGKMQLDPQPMRIDVLLRDLSVILAAGVGRKNVEVLFDVDPALPRCVIGDALRLQQVLINLAGNAIKFTEAGEVVLRLRLLGCDDETLHLQFEVRDTGIGIAPEHQERIFSGFTQAEASTSRRFGGTGLGLAISRRLVEMMGGQLQLESALGRGSRFFFSLELPLHHPAVESETTRPTGSEPLRALLVDDNSSAREMLGAMARSLGWQVDLAESGTAALQRVRDAQARDRPYQVVLVDWVMPGMDGWQTSRELRALTSGEGTGPPVVVMVTAHGREMLAQRSEQEQGLLDGFLVKPITASMLHDAVIDARAGHGPLQAALPAARPQAGSRRLAGLHLLVVEDNLNNQQVARELLEGEGAVVLLANDGQQALSLLAQAKHGPPRIDAVLMDVQMPVMDGYTATRLIRRQLALTLPIIAMTANAMPADRQACLDAGMSEHVGKPFDIEHVVAVLLRRCGTGVAAMAPRSVPAPVLPDAVLARARESGIELGEALGRMSGRTDLFLRTVRAFREKADELQKPLDGAVLHGLRGLASMLGLMPLSRLAQEAELDLREGRAPAPDWAARWAELCTRQFAALDALMPQLVLPDDEDEDEGYADEALVPCLRLLIDLLEGSDMAAIEQHDQLRGLLRAQWPATAEALETALAGLDFASAAGHCRALLRASTVPGELDEALP